MDGIYRPTLESVLQSNGEVKNTVLIKDGRTYVDIEMIWSFIDGTIQTNIENNPSLEMEEHMTTLVACTQFIPDLLTYVAFRKDLDKLTVPPEG
jgi:hypothetical protein